MASMFDAFQVRMSLAQVNSDALIVVAFFAFSFTLYPYSPLASPLKVPIARTFLLLKDSIRERLRSSIPDLLHQKQMIIISSSEKKSQKVRLLSLSAP